jgi:N-acetylmuramic acid 6-phosphate (MurNAc-6-P) etherase
MSALDQCDGHVKPAVVMLKRRVSPDEARALLSRADGRLRAALSS